jgi:hypothetical protein
MHYLVQHIYICRCQINLFSSGALTAAFFIPPALVFHKFFPREQQQGHADNTITQEDAEIFTQLKIAEQDRAGQRCDKKQNMEQRAPGENLSDCCFFNGSSAH